jgi:hypothetical protein
MIFRFASLALKINYPRKYRSQTNGVLQKHKVGAGAHVTIEASETTDKKNRVLTSQNS